jgi:hypothetical protein
LDDRDHSTISNDMGKPMASAILEIGNVTHGHLIQLNRAAGLHGTLTYWNYGNDDALGAYPKTCCGQAAMYSYLKTRGSMSINFAQFVRKYPPNNLGGTLGTSRERIAETLGKCGYKTYTARGEGALRSTLSYAPVIVCLDVGAAGWGEWGLHWVAVFAYDSGHYYLTNWEDTDYYCTRDNFTKGWNTWLTSTVAWTSSTFIVPYK